MGVKKFFIISAITVTSLTIAIMIIGSNESKKTTELQRASNLQGKCLSSAYR